MATSIAAASGTPAGARIEALDVIRGCALIGILLMNIEFFNRYSGESGMGVQQGLSGANLWFSYFVQYFVTGKFWTIFSILFGMGFGVMLMRAEAADRSFLRPYLRRIVALAAFGVLHHILLWDGDILFSYAAAATGLLIVLYGRFTYILLATLAFGGLAVVPGMGWGGGVAGTIVYFGVLAWYMRCDERITVFKRSVPVFKIVTRFLMLAAVLAISVGLLVPGLPHEARIVAPVMGSVVLLLAILMTRFHQPPAARLWRTGAGLYAMMMLIPVGIGVALYFAPDPDMGPKTVTAVAAKPADAASAERQKRVAAMLAERKAEKEKEVKVLRHGSYGDVLALRLEGFQEAAPGQIGFATQVITMFLIGLWLVQSGVMSNTRAHLPLFRKFAFIALPLGLAMGMAGGLIATHADETMHNGYQFASGLLMLGNLPASLGYIGAIVLMLHSDSVFKRISVFAPYGRMALTNYLTHSLVFSYVFFGYGLGYFGIERIWQFACVCAMVSVQVPLSHFWLSRFAYGPMEWLWRAITYWQLPAMRIRSKDAAAALQPA